MKLDGKRVLITGGTGSLGTALVGRLLKMGICKSITVFSRDEKKQHDMRMIYPQRFLNLFIGDVRSYHAIATVLCVHHIDIVFHTAALKQVGACEEYPWEAVQTNIYGAWNLITAIRETRTPVETVVGVNTDKSCLPVNVYGATKLVQERLLASANIGSECTRYVSVLYGNVMGSRGSVIPLFKQQIASGGPVTITNPDMTRFLISLDTAVDTLLAAVESALPGEVYIPYGIPAARVGDLADVMIDGRDIERKIVGIRLGEKMDEVLITEAECRRTIVRDNFLVVRPTETTHPVLQHEYVSCDHVIDKVGLVELLMEASHNERFG